MMFMHLCAVDMLTWSLPIISRHFVPLLFLAMMFATSGEKYFFGAKRFSSLTITLFQISVAQVVSSTSFTITMPCQPFKPSRYIKGSRGKFRHISWWFTIFTALKVCVFQHIEG